MTRFLPLADPAFDVTSEEVRRAREEDWYVETSYGWAVLRYDEGAALLKDRRFRQGNAQWPAQNGIHSGMFSDWWQEVLLSLEGEDHLRLRRLLQPAFRSKTIAAMRPAVPGSGQRAGRRVRPAGRGRVHHRVRRALCGAHPVRPDRDPRGQLAPGRPLGRRSRQGVRHPDQGGPAPHRGGPGRSLRLCRRARRAACARPRCRCRRRRPRHDAAHRPGAGRPAEPARARRLAGVPGVRRDGDHAQPARSGAADVAQAPRPVAAARRAPGPRRAAVEEVMRVNPTVTWVTREASRTSTSTACTSRAAASCRCCRTPPGTDPLVARRTDLRHAQSGRPTSGSAAGAHHCLGHFVARTDMAVALPLLAPADAGRRTGRARGWLPVSGNTGALRFPIVFRPEQPGH